MVKLASYWHETAPRFAKGSEGALDGHVAVVGHVMAAVMAGDAGRNPGRDLPLPAIAGHFGPPWFLPFVGAYYKLQDRLH